jgi:hypothetical protein
MEPTSSFCIMKDRRRYPKRSIQSDAGEWSTEETVIKEEHT